MIELIKIHALVHLLAFKSDRRAAAALEYALLASFIAIAIVAGVTTFGTNLGTFFSNLGGTVAGWTS
ncbi:MAG TPA: Flp family type IVb pilin [Acetobacteraceae bacterium]|nr:Flp family type IVb pilin [Acetobacteraceae bacterium]